MQQGPSGRFAMTRSSFAVVSLLSAVLARACSQSRSQSMDDDDDDDDAVMPDAAMPEPAATQFGVRLEPPLGRVIHGMGQWDTPAGNPAYLAALDSSLSPAIGMSFFSLD